MDMCVKISVALAIFNHVVVGWSYDRPEEFHHDFEYHHTKQWHNRKPGWGQDEASNNNQRPLAYQRDHKHDPHKHTNDWKTHSGEWDSGSWEYPDFPGHGHPSHWGHQPHQGWGNQQHHERPNRWPQNPPAPSVPNMPNWNQANPSTWSPPSTPPSTSSRSTSEGGSQDTLAILLCIRSCPVTSEYNPVCGSNNVTYSNPGRLDCAKYCGVDVSLRRNSACPVPGLDNTQGQPNVRPNQPSIPTLKPVSPTRFTTVEVPPVMTNEPPPAEPNPPFTISPDIINSIFTPSTSSSSTSGSSSSSTIVDDDIDIDIRTRSKLDDRN